MFIALRYRLRSRDNAPAAPSDVYLGLRSQVFQNSRAKLGLASPPELNHPWGVVMDWGMPKGTATVVAMSDGAASVYLSSGGGYIGGQSNENVRGAAKTAVETAAEFQPTMLLAAEFPLPPKGQARFYLLTDEGVFTATASDDDLSSSGHPLSKLADAMQEVVSQYRLMQDGK